MQLAVTPPAEIPQQQEACKEPRNIGKAIPADSHGITETDQEWTQVVQVIADHLPKRTPSGQGTQACAYMGAKVFGEGLHLLQYRSISVVLPSANSVTSRLLEILPGSYKARHIGGGFF